MILPALATFLVLLSALNFWGWHLSWLGVGIGGLYLALVSYLLGGRLKTLAGSFVERLGWGLLAAITALSLAGTAAFYLHFFSYPTVVVVLALLPWLGSWQETPPRAEPAAGPRWPLAALAALYLGVVLLLWFTVGQGFTDQALRSPWQTVPGLAFVLYGVAAALLLVGTRWFKNPGWAMPFYAASLAVLPLVYALGYGFDPFIHQASEQLLAASGTISPTPLYYVGQYAAVVSLNYLLPIALPLLDRWFLPLLASLALPLALAAALRPWQWERPWPVLGLLWPMVFTLSGFTYTTPQGLANLFAITTILVLAARLAGQGIPRWWPWLLTAATLATHPLTGLPLLGLTALWWYTQEHKPPDPVRKKLIALIGAATALAVPLAFTVFSLVQPSAARVQLNHAPLQSLASIGQSMANTLPAFWGFTDVSDTVYLWARPLPLIFFVLAALGLWYVNKKMPAWRWFAWSGALVALSYLILKLGATFPGLPAYEQDFYSGRLWDLAQLCWWPLAVVGGYQLWLWLQRFWPTSRWWMAGALLLTGSWYLTYPRLDFWHHDTAYNTTPADAAAVQLIDRDAAARPYVVLANQAVSAAAISTFGFKTYYNGNFYYPVPTGANPLYDVYHQATEVSAPTRTIIQSAAKLAGVKRVYLVLDRYWADYLKLVPVAVKESNQTWVVADDQEEVFRYDF